MSSKAGISKKRRFKTPTPLLRPILKLQHLRSNPYHNSAIRPADAQKEVEAFNEADRKMIHQVARSMTGKEVPYLKHGHCLKVLEQLEQIRVHHQGSKTILSQYASGDFKGTVAHVEESIRLLRNSRYKKDYILARIQAKR
jgi:hypothetical protein